MLNYPYTGRNKFLLIYIREETFAIQTENQMPQERTTAAYIPTSAAVFFIKIFPILY